MVPLAKNQALGTALLSYAGKINLKPVGDWDLMRDLDEFADDLRESLEELADAGRRRVRRKPGDRPREGPPRCMRARPRDRGPPPAPERLDAHRQGRRGGCRLRRVRDREVDRLRCRRGPGRLRGLGPAPDRHREAGRAPRRRRGAPGQGRRGARSHRLRDRRSAAVRTRPRSCSTRRCFTKRVWAAAGDPHSLRGGSASSRTASAPASWSSERTPPTSAQRRPPRAARARCRSSAATSARARSRSRGSPRSARSS